MSFFATILIFINFWSNKDPQQQLPVHFLSEIEELNGKPERPISIDVFIASYNEDVELVRYSIRDAKRMKYPFDDVEIKIHVLDDGRRDGRDAAKENMKKVAEQECVNYFSRENNEGYKAGNLKNAFEKTCGDIFVILDADTRPFPEFLEHTTGYFKEKKLAWVQTPQWFYDLTEPISLSIYLQKKIGKIGFYFGRAIEKIFIKVEVGKDLFGCDGQLFYDVILRRRNFWNAAFCCGAGSLHRREAIMNLAVKNFDRGINPEIRPFVYHASEDIFTSFLLHSDKEMKWKSIQHPRVECKMLSPQDIDTWVKQRTRYASGSLEIAIRSNPLFISGLTIWQRLSYLSTSFSYFAPLWILVFLVSPIIFFFTLTPPVNAFNFDFYKYFLPFHLLNTITIAVGCWGISTNRGDQYYVSSFWLMLRSLIAVLRGEKVKFNVTPKHRVFGNYIQHIIPHLAIIGLTIIGLLYNIFLMLQNTHPSFSGFAANTLWGAYNIFNLSIIVRAALWKPE